MSSSINLILAQGAEHTKQDNLRKIVERINCERIGGTPQVNCAITAECEDKISSLYGCYGMIQINPYTYSVEEKYDGYSYLNVQGRFFSKSLSSAEGSKGMPVEKTDRIPHLAKIMKTVYDECGADLHGELYKVGGISDDVTNIMGCNADKAQYRQNLLLEKEGHNGPLHYVLIDIRAIHGKSLVNEPHRLRHAILRWVYKKYVMPNDPHGYVKLADVLYGDPCDEFRRIVTSGGEGIIIKREDALYIPGKKPANNWIKGKKKITLDVFMTGLNEGTGKNAKLFGSIKFAMMIDGKQVECGNCSSGLDDATRLMIYDNADKLIESRQVFEIEAIQESVKSFRNAVFIRLRDDKVYNECTPLSIVVKENLV